eukprot:6214659-Pleurochrysis_carterae.AAC.1
MGWHTSRRAHLGRPPQALRAEAWDSADQPRASAVPRRSCRRAAATLSAPWRAAPPMPTWKGSWKVPIRAPHDRRRHCVAATAATAATCLRRTLARPAPCAPSPPPPPPSSSRRSRCSLDPSGRRCRAASRRRL